MIVYIGIDWSVKKHDLCYMNERGEVIWKAQILQKAEGYQQFEEQRQRIGVSPGECRIGIETSHNMLVDYLIERGYTDLYIIPPNAVKSAQGRYRQSGSKSDPSDARLIADILRVDGGKYSVWEPDLPLTMQIRAQISMVGYQNKQIYQTANRLRAILLRYYPAALEIFNSLDTPITLKWIIEYPQLRAARQVSYEEFKAFAKRHRHSQPCKLAKYYSRLWTDQIQAVPALDEIYAQQVVILAKRMLNLIEDRAQLMKSVGELYVQHPDYAIYHSLPGAGAYLEPALLSKMGDNRKRYPTVQVAQSIAGTCPVTKQSGKTRSVVFRTACDHEFRQIMQQWAKCSVRISPWARAYSEGVRPHCEKENEVYRRLANRWLEVLWRLWQDRKPYDEQRHLKAQLLRKQPKP